MCVVGCNAAVLKFSKSFVFMSGLVFDIGFVHGFYSFPQLCCGFLFVLTELGSSLIMLFV